MIIIIIIVIIIKNLFIKSLFPLFKAWSNIHDEAKVNVVFILTSLIIFVHSHKKRKDSLETRAVFS